ncbi:MAG: hypothetical protein WC348_04225 [Patescibacteria group bacterium]|jgi:hypothetical protein
MEFVLVRVENEGDRERVHRRFCQKIREAMGTWLGTLAPDGQGLTILPGSPAEEVGLKNGDKPFSVAGRRISSLEEFVGMIGSTEEGSKAAVLRKNEESGKDEEVKFVVSRALRWGARTSIITDPVHILFSECQTVCPGPVKVQVVKPIKLGEDERKKTRFVQGLRQSLTEFYPMNGYNQRQVEVEVVPN